jgi:hypothetical protein
MTRIQRTLATLALLLGVTSCGAVGFNRDWREFQATGAAGMEGRWRGSWESDWNGHTGSLRCIMTPEGEGVFLARFQSTFARVLTFPHDCLFEVSTEADGTFAFAGAQDLGKMYGGVYRYEGTVEGDAFRATYEADNGDHGTFAMTRVDDDAVGR